MAMSGYTKLFNSILASTIWRADDKTRIVWITLLAMADKHGVAEGSIPGLADFAHVSIGDCERALAVLQSPDEYSRSKVKSGRRIESVDGGWRLINHGMYRETMSADERREYLRIKQAEHRARKRTAKAAVDTHSAVIGENVNPQSTSVDKCQPAYTPSTQAESIEHRASPESKEHKATPTEGPIRASSADADFETFRQAYPQSRRVGGKPGRNAFQRASGRQTLSSMLTALEQHKRSEQWQDPKLIPLMTTWLNQERWLQVLPESSESLVVKSKTHSRLEAATNEFLRGAR